MICLFANMYFINIAYKCNKFIFLVPLWRLIFFRHSINSDLFCRMQRNSFSQNNNYRSEYSRLMNSEPTKIIVYSSKKLKSSSKSICSMHDYLQTSASVVENKTNGSRETAKRQSKTTIKRLIPMSTIKQGLHQGHEEDNNFIFRNKRIYRSITQHFLQDYIRTKIEKFKLYCASSETCQKKLNQMKRKKYSKIRTLSLKSKLNLIP